MGALAEFTRLPSDAAKSDGGTSVVTGRGALRIEVTPDTRVVRFADSSGLTCVALCLPEPRARLAGRSTLTELGRDQRALRSGDREAFVFDLGIGSPFFEFCVRTADAAAVRSLRAHAGVALFGDGCAFLADIAAMQPHRIVGSRLARIEVYQPIADADGTTPAGPHTHLLPQLLAGGLTHSTAEPIPRGWVPCARLYLGHGRGEIFAHH